MSTLSFQQYVRERLARRAASGAGVPAAPDEAAAPAQPAAAGEPRPSRRVAAADVRPELRAGGADATPVMPAGATAREGTEVLAELRSLRNFISEQIGALAWLDEARRGGSKSRLLATLLGAGFSSAVARI